MNPRIFIVTTNDSRIRIFDIKVIINKLKFLFRLVNCYIS